MEENKYSTRLKALRQLKEIKDKKNEELKAINSEIEQMERSIITEMETDGVDTVSIRGVGTAYITTKQMPTVADMESFVAWCYENNRTDMIQKRVSSKVCIDYITETNDMPEGINIYTENKIGFRRS